jgi:hypothetical protein
MRKMYLTFLLLLTTTTFCQNKDSTYKYWMTLGMWVNQGEITFDGDYSFSLGNYFYKVGYLSKDDETFHAGPDIYFFNSISGSIGKRFQSKWFEASVFCGPSCIIGEKGINQNIIKKFTTVGLESKIQLLIKPANEVGFGISFYGNLNPMKNFGGINLNVTIGNGK